MMTKRNIYGNIFIEIRERDREERKGKAMKSRNIEKIKVIAKNHSYSVSINGKVVLKDFKADSITEAIDKAVATA